MTINCVIAVFAQICIVMVIHSLHICIFDIKYDSIAKKSTQHKTKFNIFYSVLKKNRNGPKQQLGLTYKDSSLGLCELNGS